MSASEAPTARRSGTQQLRAPRTRTEDRPVLGRYFLHRRLGSGAFGTVWHARDERLDRDVAIKVLPRERIVGGRFEREAKAAARLSHPGIVTLYEAAVDDDGAYLVSELVRGATLDQLLDDGKLSDRDIVEIGIALCDALAHAHGEGIVHRDVKPSNVLIPEKPATAADIAKLTDFGVARLIGGDSLTRLTRTGDVVGTAAYMAPEQAAGRETRSSADLYSLALVIYEALTGINPVRLGTAAQRARRLGAYMPPLRRQRRDLPRQLGQGIDLALRPKPRERGTTLELRRALSAALDHVGEEAGVVESAWPTRSERAAARAQGVPSRQQPPGVEFDPQHTPELRTRMPWSSRGLAAAATAILTAWLAAHLLTPSPIAPAAAALLAAAAVVLSPRIGWLLSAASLAAGAGLQGRPGAALVLFTAALLPVALQPLKGTSWPLAAFAPVLGALGLAGAWPALAARASTAWRRAALGATGWIWLVLAGPITGLNLYLVRPPGAPIADVWTASLHSTLSDVIWPLFKSGAFAPAIVWALGAAVLPLLIKSRSLALDAVQVVVWATLLALATTMVIDAGTGLGAPRTVLLGAVASGAVALAPSVMTAWRHGRGSPELA